MVTEDEGKAELFIVFFASVFNSKNNCSPGMQTPELEDRECAIIQGEMVSDLLHHLDTHRSLGLDGIHLRVPKELAEELTKSLSIIYHQSWLTTEVPVQLDWKLANVTPIDKNGQKEDPGNYRLSDLDAGKGHGADCSQCHHTAYAGQPGDQAPSAWVWKGRSCLTILVSFHNKVSLLVDQRKAVDMFTWTSRAFDTISHNIILEKLSAYCLDM
ncbi:hypothetical protein DUI87_07147 [Hirundo rustica rustica]|uniref:Reverse transcriptase domain-containing protein n=1 Tax=Hirundo rustica rustica TaxID=333673 RepID=A0A3M0KNY4_HIRRU|nr:hypothetical protein DUI87_07147 [Hirundo rustica rustica]